MYLPWLDGSGVGRCHCDMSWWGLAFPFWLWNSSTVSVNRHGCLYVCSILTVSSSVRQPTSASCTAYMATRARTYDRQRRLGWECLHGLLSLCVRSGAWGCGRDRHTSPCRSGGAGGSGLVGRCSSAHRRSYWQCQERRRLQSDAAYSQGQERYFALLWRHCGSESGASLG